MDAIGVLMACPMSPYLEQELESRFKLFRFWNFPQKKEFLKDNSSSIRAVVGNATAGADADLIESLPSLEIVANFSVGLDKVDLVKCKEKGIRVTNTPDVLTEDVADLASPPCPTMKNHSQYSTNLHLGEDSLIQHSDRSTLPCTRRCSVPRDVDQVQTMLELDPRNYLCEHIGRIICSTNLLKQNIPFIHNFSDEMETDVNVLGAGMMNLVLCQTNGTLTITIHLNVLLNKSQVFNQPV